MATETPTLTIPPAIAALQLELDDGGHTAGSGQACIMEVVAMLAGEGWSDHPACTSPVIGAFCRTFWDRTPKTWQGLLDRVDRIAGSASTKAVDRQRGYLAADWAVRRFAPRWLRRLDLEDDAVALEALASVVDEKTARAAYNAGGDIRSRAWKRYEEALVRIRAAAEAAWAAGAAEAAWAAGAAGAAEVAGAAGAAWAAELKGKTYGEKKAWFRAKIDEALKDEVDASIADGFALLDAMLDLGSVEAARTAVERPTDEPAAV